MRVEIDCDLSVTEIAGVIQCIFDAQHAEDDQPEVLVDKELSHALGRR
jgi:hypothetical protein